MKIALALAFIASPAAAQTVSGVTIDGQRYVPQQLYEAAPLIDNDAEADGVVLGTDFPVTPHITGMASITTGLATEDPRFRLRAGLTGQWGRWTFGAVYDHVGQQCGIADTGRVCSSAYYTVNASASFDAGHGWEVTVRAMNATDQKHFDGPVADGAPIGRRWQVEVWKHWGR